MYSHIFSEQLFPEKKIKQLSHADIDYLSYQEIDKQDLENVNC